MGGCAETRLPVYRVAATGISESQAQAETSLRVTARPAPRARRGKATCFDGVASRRRRCSYEIRSPDE